MNEHYDDFQKIFHTWLESKGITLVLRTQYISHVSIHIVGTNVSIEIHMTGLLMVTYQYANRSSVIYNGHWNKLDFHDPTFNPDKLSELFVEALARAEYEANGAYTSARILHQTQRA